MTVLGIVQRSVARQPVVYVLATTVDGTRAALTAAVPLARGSRARLVVLVPQIVPYPLAVDGPTDATVFTERRYRDLVHEADGEADVKVYLCRTPNDVLHTIPPASTVVVGGASGAVLLSREERLSRQLTRLGYHTVFASNTRGSLVAYAAALLMMLAAVGVPH